MTSTTAQDHKALGNAHFKSKDYESAIKEFTTAIDLEPENFKFYSNRSAVYAAKGDFDKALADGQKCIELAKDWPKVMFHNHQPHP